MGIMDDAIEDGVGDGGFTNHVVPLGDGELGGNQRRFAPVAFFEDFQQIEALLIIEGVSAPVVEHQQLHAGEFVDEAREAAVETCHGKILKQTRDPQIEDGMIEPGGLTPEGTGQPGFASPGLAGEDEVLVGFQPGALRQLQGVAPVKAATGREVDIFDAGIDEAQLRCGQPIGQPPVGAHGGFAIEHQAKPFIATEIAGVVLFGQLSIGGRHSGQAKRLHLVKRRVGQHHVVLSFTGNKPRHGCWRVEARL